MLEALLKRDRYWVLGGLTAITLLSWAYLIYLAQDMARMDMPMDMGMSAAMPQTQAWQPREFVLMFGMWAVMMVAMMVPTAAPMILTFAAISRKRPAPQAFLSRTSAFVLGYLLVWTSFALIATVAQGLLHQAALLSPKLATTNTLLASFLLLAAGLFQWTPFKYTCLHHCRSPFSFLLNEWRDGTKGALYMGLNHGGYCLGCCWSLMALLFVAGVMNLLWIATLAALILVEKVAPKGHYLSRVAGVLFIGWGIWLAVTALV
jgi:predicted metal-binding membrane protein